MSTVLNLYFFYRDVTTDDGVRPEKAIIAAGDAASAADVLKTYLIELHEGKDKLRAAYDPATHDWQVREVTLDTPQVLELVVG